VTVGNHWHPFCCSSLLASSVMSCKQLLTLSVLGASSTQSTGKPSAVRNSTFR
jgi:hypothetical protein